MNAEELEDAVLGIVQDSGWSNVILDLFNLCRDEIAGEVDLPALHTVATVATSVTASTVALPSSYSKGLYWVGSTAQKKRIGARKSDYHNLLTFLEKYPVQDQIGLVTDVVIQGTSLLYQGKAADTLTLRYYAAPAAMNSEDSPDELPAHLHRALLVNFACREIYNQIESGKEKGATPNADKFGAMYSRALIALKAWAAPLQPREPKYITDMAL